MMGTLEQATPCVLASCNFTTCTLAPPYSAQPGQRATGAPTARLPPHPLHPSTLAGPIDMATAPRRRTHTPSRRLLSRAWPLSLWRIGTRFGRA